MICSRSPLISSKEWLPWPLSGFIPDLRRRNHTISLSPIEASKTTGSWEWGTSRTKHIRSTWLATAPVLLSSTPSPRDASAHKHAQSRISKCHRELHALESILLHFHRVPHNTLPSKMASTTSVFGNDFQQLCDTLQGMLGANRADLPFLHQELDDRVDDLRKLLDTPPKNDVSRNKLKSGIWCLAPRLDLRADQS